MTTFDPAAATAAYLAEMSPQAHARATAYTQGGHWLLLWGWLVTIIACVLILKSGVLSKVQAGVQRRKPRPLLASFLIGLIFLALDFVIELPWASYSGWWREKAYGLNNQTWPGWFADNAVSTAIELPLFALFLMAIYWLIRRARRTWPIWSGLLAAAFFLFTAAIAPVFIEPLINTYQQAPPGPVRDAVVALGKANGVPTDKIYVFNGSKQSDRYTANVSGFFGTARVALSDSMFRKGADIAEVRGVVGHEMGHYVHQHLLFLAAFTGVMVALCGWLIQATFPAVRGWLGATDVGEVSDPAGLPILYAIFTTLALLATPVTNGATRLVESDADAFSLEHAREPDGMARALVKTIEYRASSPSELEEFLFYDHPSVQRRIRRAMDWKAAHLSELSPPAAPAGSGPTSAGR
jgi:STE24 endopeptidase